MLYICMFYCWFDIQLLSSLKKVVLDQLHCTYVYNQFYLTIYDKYADLLEGCY